MTGVQTCALPIYLRELLKELGALPAFVGGSSAGARTAMRFYLRHPTAVRGLLLMRVTGGKVAAERLPDMYYGQFIKIAQAGGMAAICAHEQYKERIEANPATRERLMAMPSLPTVAEAGLKGYESSQWYGLFAPAGTPADILNLLNSHVARFMQGADIKQRLGDEGVVPVGSTREQLAAHVKSEIAKWANVIKLSGARVD